MTGRLVIGVDSSTQSTKVLVVDRASGKVVATGTGQHDVVGVDGARESDPDSWHDALASALDETGLASQASAISVAGQQHGLVIRGERGEAIRPAMLWNDTRSALEAELLIEALGGADAWAREIGIVPVASFTVSKWAWLRRNEPDAAAATVTIGLPHDDVTRLLTSEHVTDRGDASGTGWWSTATEDYSDTVLGLDLVDLQRSVLPRVLGPTEVAGTVTSDAASRLGLAPGIPVGPGTGDNMGAALGLALDPGTPVISLGTSGTAYVTSDVRTNDPSGTCAGFADATGRFLPLACTLNATQAVDRVAEWLGLDRDADVSPSEGVVALPYFDGERTPNLPNAAATLTGLRHSTVPSQILMAAYEGVVTLLLDAIDELGRQGSGLTDGAPLVVIGGGAKGAVWREVLSRLSGRPLVIPQEAELVALGAAVQAAAILDGETPAEVAARWDRSVKRIEPSGPADQAVRERINAVQAATARLNDS